LFPGNSLNQCHNAPPNTHALNFAESTDKPNGGGSFEKTQTHINIVGTCVIERSAIKEE